MPYFKTEVSYTAIMKEFRSAIMQGKYTERALLDIHNLIVRKLYERNPESINHCYDYKSKRYWLHYSDKKKGKLQRRVKTNLE